MRAYLDLITDIFANGIDRGDRTGTGTRAVFGRMARFDLLERFPAITTKLLYFRTATKEMLWMLSGQTNIRKLLENKVRIWSEWPHKQYVNATGDNITLEEFESRILADDAFAQQWGSIGPGYGYQWRHWEGADGKHYDQLATAIDLLRNNPESRRIIIEGWNVAQLDSMSLPPCHKTYTFRSCPATLDQRKRYALYLAAVETNPLWRSHLEKITSPIVSDDEMERLLDEAGIPKRALSCHLDQRSVDVVNGLPFNWSNQALMTHILAKLTDHIPVEIIWTGIDVHIYKNCFEQAKLQLTRKPIACTPRLRISDAIKSLDDLKIENHKLFELVGYESHPAIKAPVAV